MDTTPQTPGPGPTPPPHATGTDRFFDSIRSWGIYRTQDRWIGGVAHGLARRWGLDPAIVRALFVASLLLGGIGLVAYALGWAFLPEEADGRIHAQQLMRGDFDIAIVGAFVMIATGLSWMGPWRFLGAWGNGLTGVFWALAIVGIIVWIATSRSRGDAQRPPAGPRPGPDTPPPTAAHQPWTGTTGTYTAGSASTGHSAAENATAGNFGAGTYAAAPPVSQPAPAPSGWTPPKGPVVLGAGAVSVSLVVGITALTVAGLMLAERSGTFDGPLLLTSLAVLVTLAGIATVVAGIRGRSAGSLGTLAVIALLVAAPAALWNGAGSTLDVRSAERLVLGDRTSAPDDRVVAGHGFVFGAGSWNIDLTDVPLSSETLVVPVSFGMGDATITLPAGAAWVADVRLGAGEVEAYDADGAATSVDGVGIRRTLESEAVRDGATPTLRVDLRAGLGSVNLTEEPS